MKTLVTLGLILLLVVGVTVWLVQGSGNDGPSIEIVASQTGSTTQKVRFISPQTNEVVEVEFAGTQAILNGEGYQNLALTQTEAASGARYESTAENVSIWNKGAEVTMYRGRQVIFIGQTEESMGNPNPAGEDESVQVSTSSVSLRGNTWVWKESTRTDGTKVTPNKPGVFTLEFAQDGAIRGTTDCNGFGGQYTLDGGSLNNGPLAMTKMFCEGSQENEFIALATGAGLVAIDEGTPATLTITTDAGVSVFTQK